MYKDILIGDQLKIITNKVISIIDTDIQDLFVTVSAKMVQDSKSIIYQFDRIDTGTMLSTVRAYSEFHTNKAIVTLESNAIIKGAKESHSSFNETGTKYMKGIHFIGDSFNENIKGIENTIERLISEIAI